MDVLFHENKASMDALFRGKTKELKSHIQVLKDELAEMDVKFNNIQKKLNEAHEIKTRKQELREKRKNRVLKKNVTPQLMY